MHDVIDSAVRRAFGDDADDESFVERIWRVVERRREPDTSRAGAARWRASGRRLAWIVAAVLACVAVAGGAIAAVTDTGIGDGTTTGSAPAIVYSDALRAYALGRTPAIIPPNLPALVQASVVTTDMHQAATRDGVTPYLAPSTSGGLCAMWEHNGGTWAISCSTRDRVGDTVGTHWFDEPDGSWRYVGFEPDGVTSVSAADGTQVPVIDNAYVSREPVK